MTEGELAHEQVRQQETAEGELDREQVWQSGIAEGELAREQAQQQETAEGELDREQAWQSEIAEGELAHEQVRQQETAEGELDREQAWQHAHEQTRPTFSETQRRDPNQSWYLAEDFNSKVKALQRQFFPERPEADLSNLHVTAYPQEIEDNEPISEEEVRKVLAKLRTGKAPGRTGVTNEFLKLMGEPLVCAITSLAQGCQNWEYFPEAFKIARTVAIRKAGKKSYQEPNSWRPIALLETIGKTVEAVMATRLRTMAEKHGMLPPQQMGARQGKSTETALTLLLSQIRTIWEEKNSVATLLSLDMSGAFPRVLQEQLTHAMKRKEVFR